MKIPAVRGIIDRRILVNFQVDPEVLARFLPAPFRPKLVNGSGIAAACGGASVLELLLESDDLP